MLAKQDSASSSSSPVDSEYDFGFGEILEYHEDAEGSCEAFTFMDPFATSYDSNLSVSSFDGKGKRPIGREDDALDRYHPENSKREVIEHVVRSMSNSGEINVSHLVHSSEQWSNYRDLCDAVKTELRRTGYSAATVDCVDLNSERHIVYQLS